MDGLPDVLGFKTQRSRENEPMAVVIGKEGPQGLWEGLGLGLGGRHCRRGGKSECPGVSNVPCVSFYPPPAWTEEHGRHSGRWLGWVGTDAGEGDECYKVIGRESPKKALCLPMQDRRLGEWREREPVVRGRGLESWVFGKKCLQPLPSSSSPGRAGVKG